MNHFTSAFAEPWAITADGFISVKAIAAGPLAEKFGALSAEDDQPLLGTTTATIRDGVAIIPVRGPLFTRSNWITRAFGFGAYDVIARDFRTAMRDPAVKSIVLDVDSPGGMVTGTAELASLVFQARGQGKPIIAFAGGMMASAAYWVGSAADRIVAAETALLGSIGVRLDVTDTSERDARSGVKRRTIVSRQSPFKADDHVSEEGRERVQTVVDGLAQVFVEAVARHRGTTADAVVAGYGKGDVMVARDAKAAGMADDLGTFEGMIGVPAWGGNFSASAAPSSPHPIQKPASRAKAMKPKKTQSALSAYADRMAALERNSARTFRDAVEKASRESPNRSVPPTRPASEETDVAAIVRRIMEA
ncbi:S49 family peptidase [Azospirillum sp.]|uniref:S49 family peptidase n=1 Tax=Azospirillum sp. TaxID=34012 RepID=UPI002D39DA4E|nr:S49 family peptidase [Azospirillum sp.]HYD65728.1 S49 family peptidase [Azospirillum sp.]